MHQTYQNDFNYSELIGFDDSYYSPHLNLHQELGLPVFIDSLVSFPDKERNQFLEPELSIQPEVNQLDQKYLNNHIYHTQAPKDAKEKECNFDAESESTMKKQNSSSFLAEGTRLHEPRRKKQVKKSKGDQMRNLYPGLMKTAINAILNPKYKKKLKRIRYRITRGSQLVSQPQMMDFFEKMKSVDYSLKDIYYYMNYQEGDQKEKILKQIFHSFMVWFIGCAYTLSILTSDQCQHKELYLKGKNVLRYLPNLKTKSRRSQLQTTISPCKNSRTI